MKLLHISDLHLGRRIYGLSYLEDQKTVLEDLLQLIRDEEINTVLIAGDIYDKQIPSIEAVALADWFITELARLECNTFIISGNHDSPERLQFGSSLMKQQGIHIAGVFDGTLQKNVLRDEYGDVNIYMLPFAKYSTMLSSLPTDTEEKPESLTELIRQVIKAENIPEDQRNIIMYHGFVLGGMGEPETSESEQQLGGMQLVSADVFEAFDYTALGHIHKPQWVKRNKIRYSGSLMKYSFSETAQKKSVTIIDMKEKGDISIETRELKPCRDMRVIRGSFDALIEHAESSDDLIRAELADVEVVPYALEKLRVHYPNLLELCYIWQTERTAAAATETSDIENKPLSELLDEFFRNVYQYELVDSSDAAKLMNEITKEAEEI